MCVRVCVCVCMCTWEKKVSQAVPIPCATAIPVALIICEMNKQMLLMFDKRSGGGGENALGASASGVSCARVCVCVCVYVCVCVRACVRACV